MKLRPTYSVIALAALIAPLAQAETKAFPTGPFSSIEAKGGVDVVYTPDSSAAVEVEQADGDFSDILIETEGETLVISRVSLSGKRGWYKNTSVNRKNGVTTVKVNGDRKPSYTVRVSAPSLTALSAANSAFIDASGLSGDRIDASASSSADINLAGSATVSDIRASSSGSVNAANFRVGALLIDASSSGDVVATSKGGDVTVEASSSSDVEITAEDAGRVEIRASSSADIELDGSCSTLDAKASSSADISARDLVCENVSITTSSSGDATVNATSSLVARASSGGDVNVYGDPTTRDADESSGGDVSYRN